MAFKSPKLSLFLFLALFTNSLAELPQPKETEMTLYFQDYTGGPNATVTDITSPVSDGLLRFAKFGAIFLEIQGTSAQFERLREVAVVGGTGIFRFARGYATFETIHYDSTLHYAVIQCSITVLHYY